MKKRHITFENVYKRFFEDVKDANGNFFTVRLRTNLDRTKMEHRQKRKVHKKISSINFTLYNLIRYKF